MATSLEWKVGDEFRIINPEINQLKGLRDLVYKVKRLTPKGRDNRPLTNFDVDKFIWFSTDRDDIICCYVSKSNIRPLSKLEKALK